MSEADHPAEHRFHWLLDALHGYRRRRGEIFDVPEREVRALLRAARQAIADRSVSTASALSSLVDALARRLDERRRVRRPAPAQRRELRVVRAEDGSEPSYPHAFVSQASRARNAAALVASPASCLDLMPVPLITRRARLLEGDEIAAGPRRRARPCRLRCAPTLSPTPASDEDHAMTQRLGAVIVAGLEICVRLTPGIHPDQRPRIRSPADMARHFADHLDGALDREIFLVAPLDARDRLIGIHLAAIGTSTHVYVAPCDVLRPVLLLSSPRFYVAHTHPSGALSPSPADIALTQRLCRCAGEFGVELCDHLILGFDGAFRSLEQRDRCVTSGRRNARLALAACDTEID